jgi:hypothetical protein
MMTTGMAAAPKDIERPKISVMKNSGQGVITSTTYAANASKAAMRPVLLALAAWGNTNVADTWVPPANYLTKPAKLEE